MLTFINAKINLGLRVVSRLPNGYHRLQSIFYPVGLYNGTPSCPEPFCDVLETTPAPEFSLSVGGWDNPLPPRDNLVWKAWDLYSAACRKNGIQPAPAHMQLLKQIPSEAGMGGGSADAAFALAALDHINGDALGHDELVAIARPLGADCPFFLLNRPALADGIGDRLSPLPERLKGFWCAIVKPKESMSTPKAFSLITPRGSEADMQAAYLADLSFWREALVNDFETPFFHLYPHCRHIKEQFYADGAIYTSLTGSGSAFFAIFADRDAATEALKRQQTPFKALALL